MSIPDEQLKRLLLQLAELSAKNVQLIQVLDEQLNGQAWVLRKVAEALMTAAPEVRPHLRQAFATLLASPDAIPGELARELTEHLHRAAAASEDAHGA